MTTTHAHSDLVDRLVRDAQQQLDDFIEAKFNELKILMHKCFAQARIEHESKQQGDNSWPK